MKRKKRAQPKEVGAVSETRSATEMKPIRKVVKVVSKYPTFTTPENLEDLLYVHWRSMNLIGEDDEVHLKDLPPIIDITITIKKGGRSKYRVLNDET